MLFFFFQAEDGIRDGRVTGVQTCALPIFSGRSFSMRRSSVGTKDMGTLSAPETAWSSPAVIAQARPPAEKPTAYAVFTLLDRKSTRLNSSHPSISYAVFCLKKKTKKKKNK